MPETLVTVAWLGQDFWLTSVHLFFSGIDFTQNETAEVTCFPEGPRLGPIQQRPIGLRPIRVWPIRLNPMYVLCCCGVVVVLPHAQAHIRPHTKARPSEQPQSDKLMTKSFEPKCTKISMIFFWPKSNKVRLAKVEFAQVEL